jgi:hypothetical protein
MRIRKYLANSGGVEVGTLATIATPVGHVRHPDDPYIGLDCISSSSCSLARSTVGEDEISGSARSLPEGPIISRLRPYLNKVSYVPSSFAGSLGSTEILCVRPNVGVNGWYLYGVLKTQASIAQLNPLATGSTHPRIERDDVLDLIVPWVDDHDLLARPLERAQSSYILSDALIVAARYLMEGLIEGRIEESQLSEAQEALSRSDYRPDQAILSRITSKGMDIQGMPSIFSDLDALQRAQEEAFRGTSI